MGPLSPWREKQPWQTRTPRFKKRPRAATHARDPAAANTHSGEQPPPPPKCAPTAEASTARARPPAPACAALAPHVRFDPPVDAPASLGYECHLAVVTSVLGAHDDLPHPTS